MPVQTQYHGDEFLAPKEAMTGTQSMRASGEAARKSQAELIQKRRRDEDKLAEDIIEECRVQLMLKFRFLDRALWRMKLESVRSGLAYPIASDGKSIYYDPERIIARFRESFDEMVRDYLHLVMHCIFRHPWDRNHKDSEAWSLTSDMIVESVIMDLCGDRFASAEDDARKNALDEIALYAGGMLPNRIYEFLSGLVQTPAGQQFRGLGRSHLNEWHALFERDDHATWPANAKSDDSSQGDKDAANDVVEDDENPDFEQDGLQTETMGNDESGEEQSRSTQTLEKPDEDEQSDNGTQADKADNDEGSDEASEQFDISDLENDHDDSAESNWEELAKEIEMNLETFSKEWGDQAGNLIANLTIANRRKFDYTDFLRSFSVVTEQILLNPEEFDYTYYTFGMEMYGNMPFIEPLEYKEADTLHDFVIAIDTSESVSGPLVRKFIEHTFSILKETESFATTVNIHLIQADSKVQHDLKITDLKDIDRAMENYQIRGFGGTDFRPTFDYVTMLRERGELDSMKGMIYFTDGYGQFPEKMPDYDVAFVFVDDGSRELPPVPPWAIRLVLDEHDIGSLKTDR